jgi:hypothetical protein
MSVLLRIDKHKAILRGAEWRCAYAPLEEELNRFTRSWVQRDAELSQLNGDLEEAIASEVARRFDGRVGLRVGNPRRINLRRYHNLRQLDLFSAWDR